MQMREAAWPTSYRLCFTGEISKYRCDSPAMPRPDIDTARPRQPKSGIIFKMSMSNHVADNRGKLAIAFMIYVDGPLAMPKGHRRHATRIVPIMLPCMSAMSASSSPLRRLAPKRRRYDAGAQDDAAIIMVDAAIGHDMQLYGASRKYAAIETARLLFILAIELSDYRKYGEALRRLNYRGRITTREMAISARYCRSCGLGFSSEALTDAGRSPYRRRIRNEEYFATAHDFEGSSRFHSNDESRRLSTMPRVVAMAIRH